MSLLAAVLTAGLFAGLAYAALSTTRAEVDAAFQAAVVFSVAATLLLVRTGGQALPWVIAATALYLLMFALANLLPSPLWDVARGAASTAAFGNLAWALVLHGRTT